MPGVHDAMSRKKGGRSSRLLAGPVGVRRIEVVLLVRGPHVDQLRPVRRPRGREGIRDQKRLSTAVLADGPGAARQAPSLDNWWLENAVVPFSPGNAADALDAWPARAQNTATVAAQHPAFRIPLPPDLEANQALAKVNSRRQTILRDMAKAAPRPGNVESPIPASRPSSAPTTRAGSPTPASRSSRSTSERDVADLDLDERLGEPGEYPFTRGIHPEMYRSRRWTMRQYAGYATAKETNTRYRYLLEHGSTGLSMAFDLPTQLGRDSDDPLLPRRGRPHRRRDRLDRRHAHGVRPDPARPGLDLDDDQRAGGDPAAALRAGRRGAGRAVRAAARHGPERHPQGVRGARELHLPARGRDAPDDRHLRLLPQARAEVEHDLDLRLPHAREGLLGRAGGRVHALERDRLRAGRDRRRASRSTSSRPSSRSSSTATTTSSRRSPSSAPCARCGRRSCATASARRTRARRWSASTPRPAARR